MKKLVSIALILAALLTQTLVSCGNNDTPNDTNDTENTDSVKNDVPVADICKAIEEEFGDNFTADFEVDSETLDATYGIKSEWVKEYYAKIAMISFQIDQLIAVRAADGHGDDVYKALESYRDYYVDNSMQYPMNMSKASAATVYRNGDYVFFMILGYSDDDSLLDDDAKALEFYKNENQRAIDVIDSKLGK
ncbi:MAG: DUF4358 domain-containing protein [Clostridiales bacterium]|nr:DUF4358 domain-containing protein [Clostridiales bacterium]